MNDAVTAQLGARTENRALRERINRRSPLPLHSQLSRVLAEQILRGEWKPTERLASEPEISEQFGVSRATVRHALQALESEGLIERIKGRGTFVADTRKRSWLLQSSQGFFHEEVGLGFNVTSEVLRAEVAPLPYWAAGALQLPEGGTGVVLERVRRVDGLVALHVTDYLPPSLSHAALSADAAEGSLYECLERQAGVTVYGGRRTLDASHAKPEIARLLEVGPRTALLLIESTSWDADLRPFHCYQTWVRTDRVRIDIDVVLSPSAAPVDARGGTLSSSSQRDGG